MLKNRRFIELSEPGGWPVKIYKTPMVASVMARQRNCG